MVLGGHDSIVVIGEYVFRRWSSLFTFGCFTIIAWECHRRTLKAWHSYFSCLNIFLKKFYPTEIHSFTHSLSRYFGGIRHGQVLSITIGWAEKRLSSVHKNSSLCLSPHYAPISIPWPVLPTLVRSPCVAFIYKCQVKREPETIPKFSHLNYLNVWFKTKWRQYIYWVLGGS